MAPTDTSPPSDAKLPAQVLEALKALLEPRSLALARRLYRATEGLELAADQHRLAETLAHLGLVHPLGKGSFQLTGFGRALLGDLERLAPGWERLAHKALEEATEWGAVFTPPPPDPGLEWGPVELAAAARSAQEAQLELAEAARSAQQTNLRLDDLVTEEHLIDFEILTGPDQPWEVEFGPVAEPVYQVIWGALLQAARRGEPSPLPRPRPPVKLALAAEPAEILGELALPEGLVAKALAHLRAGRNLLLVGPPSTGKSTLARRLAESLCGSDNYTPTQAQADWRASDLLGWLEQDEQGRAHFIEGLASSAARKCEASITGGEPRPHYLIIDNFERADMDLAFGKLFTVFEYRELLPLLTASESQGKPYLMPPEFRLIATYDTATPSDTATFQMGYALRRRFAFLEVGPAPPTAEAQLLLARLKPTIDGETETELARLQSLAKAVRRHYPLGTGYLLKAVELAEEGGLERGLAQALAPVWPMLSLPARRNVAEMARELWGGQSELAAELLASEGRRMGLLEALSQV